jgi:hypothetical protein
MGLFGVVLEKVSRLASLRVGARHTGNRELSRPSRVGRNRSAAATLRALGQKSSNVKMPTRATAVCFAISLCLIMPTWRATSEFQRRPYA